MTGLGRLRRIPRSSGRPCCTVFRIRGIPLGRIQQKTETIQGDTKTTEYGYDTVGRLITVAENGSLVRQYHYDDNGNRTEFEDVEHGTTTLGTYDPQDRLLTYGNFTYTYTRNGA